MAAARYPGLKAGAPQSPRKARQSRAHVEPSCATDNTVESEGGEGWKSDRDAQLAEGPWRLTDMQLGLAVIRRTPQRRSSTLLLVHLVWSTARRDPRLVPDLDAWLHEALRRKAAQSGAEALAIGNASDHVHVVARYPATLALSALAQALKGASSYLWNEDASRPRLRWQAGYWAESIGPTGAEPLLRYVARQREHHAATNDPEAWETVPSPAST
jgi:putative transposase